MMYQEKGAIFSLSLIMAFRMLGMFMLLPVFSLYLTEIKGATPSLIGMALGVYGLTQACLQIPLGHLSDRVGRKKVITAGLLLFAGGSLIAAFAHSITGIIIGRAMQGAGAIGSTILAMAADLSRDENRSKTMAVLGFSIALSFALSLMIGPVINHYFQLQGIFLTTLVLAIFAILMLHTIVPNPPTIFTKTSDYPGKQAASVLKNTQLMRLNAGIFSLHAILTASFIGTPLLLTHRIHFNPWQQSLLYLLVLVLAFAIMLPFIIIGEKKRQLKRFFRAAIALILLCELTLLTQPHAIGVIAPTLVLFFAAFTFLEASLPSLVSKIAPLQRKGAAMGIYSSSQFAGIFLGGSLGGFLFEHFQFIGLFSFCASIAGLWLITTLTMPDPPYLSTIILNLPDIPPHLQQKLHQRLQAQPGVSDLIIATNEKLIYIKADRKITSKDQLRKIVNTCNLAE